MNYQKEKYTDRSPIEYFEHGRGHYLIHEDTEALLYYLLKMLAIKGEKATFSFVKYELLKGKVPYEKKELEKPDMTEFKNFENLLNIKYTKNEEEI